jgi:4-hydroxybenzoate polyprenyltransferase
MNFSSQRHLSGPERLKLFFALSRTPHAVLDMATPCLAALLWLGAFPPLRVVLLGLITVFAGYTSVYALNDVINHRSDREKVQQGGFQDAGNYLDGVMVRHPLAHGLIGLGESLFWTTGWGVLAVAGAFMLNPVCVLVFMSGCALETVYCLMWRVTWLRSIVSGAVKTSGALAAVFAVDSHPSFSFLLFLFLWLFFWEIGGQNIPNDWADIEEDRRVQAKTIPVKFGPETASVFIVCFLVITPAVSYVLLRLTPYNFGLPYLTACLLAGICLLLVPAFRLFKTRDRSHAIALFNRASYYPLALLVVVTARSLL